MLKCLDLHVLTPASSPLTEQTAHGRLSQPQGRRSSRLHLQEIIQRAGGRQGHGARRSAVSGQQTKAEERPEETLQSREVGPQCGGDSAVHARV